MNPSITRRVIDLAMQLQQIPAPTFNERKRAKFIQTYAREQGIKDVRMDDVGNVYIHLKGSGNKPAVVVSAHLDTVFPPGTDLSTTKVPGKISGPGIGDNSVGLAGLFGLYWAFSEKHRNLNYLPQLDGDLWLIADVAEEGLGNLKGMKAVVDRFADQALAFIVLEGMSLGQVYHRGLGVIRYRISVHTKGGHSWVDYGSPSAIHELADLVVKIKALHLPVETRTTINFGTITGGISVNTIAADASCELDLRSEGSQELSNLSRQVVSLVEVANQKGKEKISISAEPVGDRPGGQIRSDHPLVRTTLECYAHNGIKAKLNIGSTDANEPLSCGLPAICVGLTTGGGAHTTWEYIDTQPISQGLKTLIELVQAVFRM